MLDCAYLERLSELSLLLVNYTKPEVDFVGLLEARLHAHDLGEGFFGMLERTVAIVQYADPIPQLGLLEA
jgi:hypothetical protein